jgi:hypothetical protein
MLQVYLRSFTFSAENIAILDYFRELPPCMKSAETKRLGVWYILNGYRQI